MTAQKECPKCGEYDFDCRCDNKNETTKEIEMVNKVIILGRLGVDPEVKYTDNGSVVCNFSLATSEKWTDKDGQKKESTEWHRVVVWGKQGENCMEFLKKGSQVYLEGKIKTREWENKEGNKVYTTEIIANNVRFLSPKGE